MKTWTLDRIPITNNKRLRSHWATRRKENQAWKQLVRAVCGIPRINEIQGKHRLTVTVYRSRYQDPDNMAGSVKPILDALVECGWLVDDSPEFLELRVSEIKCPRKEQRTVLELSPLNSVEIE